MSETFKSLMLAHGDVVRELIENEGEMTPEHEEFFAALIQKVDGLESFRLALDAEETRLDYYIDMFSAVKKRVKARKEWLDRYVISNLQMNEKTEISGDMIKLVLQNNPPTVVIDDEKMIPNGFMTQKEIVIESRPDKKTIGEFLKSGKDVPGARLVRGVRLVAKPNSILAKSKAVAG